MKKSNLIKITITSLIIAAMAITSISTAFADDDISRINTEGKILAAMEQNKLAMLEDSKAIGKAISQMQEQVAMTTEVTQKSSRGVLSALGQLQDQQIKLEKELKSTSAENIEKLEILMSELQTVHVEAVSIFENSLN